ncbi:hypothetical protein N431DRAFT_417394 [Stipitochalara longipes BDJ]|nr:hypothetical protein N431DRAFT_417394 [Stipitochalara longipes BDJ]
MSTGSKHSTQRSISNTESDSSNIHRSLSRPRPRPVLSCLRCRSRKIKCDRLLPCKQCTLTGHDSQCSYSLRPKAESSSSQSQNGGASVQISTNAPMVNIEDPNSSSTAIGQSQSSLEKVEDLLSLQKRIQTLERLYGNHSRGPTDSSTSKMASDAGGSSGCLLKIDAALSIKTSGPRYHSETYKKSLLHHFGIAGQFIHAGFNDPYRAPVMNELRTFYERFTKARKIAAKTRPEYNRNCSMSDLLPDRSICDKAISSYFRFFENSLRILHYPSFMDDYHLFWASVENEQEEFGTFVPQLAVILAIFYALEDSTTPAPPKENRIAFLCGHVEVWLDNLMGRKQLTMSTLRTRALLIVAQQVGAVHADEVWKSTGNLMRSAMAAGFHRDPSEFSHVSTFEGEMRRKLWTTILEMDLAASLKYGMPLMLHDSNFTCKTPSNLDDIDLFDGMAELPPSKPSGKTTDSSFQLALTESLPLRIEAMKQSGAPKDIQARIHAFEEHLRHPPPKLRLESDAKEDLEQLFGTILLNVYILRILSHLYRLSDCSTNSVTSSITAGLQCSLSVLSYQSMLDRKISDSETGDWEISWNLFHVLCKSDIMQAALDVCLHAQVPGLVSWTTASLLLAIDETIANLTKRIGRNGSDIKDIMRLSVISQLLKAQVTQGNREEMMKEGTESVLFACRRAAAQQDGTENEKAMQISHSPSTQLSEGHAPASVDWSVYAPGQSIANNDLASYLDMNEAHFGFSSDYVPTSMYGEPWNQY